MGLKLAMLPLLPFDYSDFVNSLSEFVLEAQEALDEAQGENQLNLDNIRKSVAQFQGATQNLHTEIDTVTRTAGTSKFDDINKRLFQTERYFIHPGNLFFPFSESSRGFASETMVQACADGTCLIFRSRRSVSRFLVV